MTREPAGGRSGWRSQVNRNVIPALILAVGLYIIGVSRWELLFMAIGLGLGTAASEFHRRHRRAGRPVIDAD
jgi:hypothetical protein